MAPNPQIVKSVEQLKYRVTVGDVASVTGLDLNLAQQGLLALATDAGGHLQVAESGEIAYSFPQNFKTILRNKYWKLRFKQWWERVWRVLFYLIRISFGIVLIASILLMLVAIAVLVIAISSTRDSDNDSGGGSSYGGGGYFYLPNFWFGPNLFWFFDPNYNYRRRQQRKSSSNYQMNFLEAIFSFLFGDGNPNADLEEQRFTAIAQIIRNHGGAVVAEQIAPYLDRVDTDEDYMIPVLSRFNGYPEVSPQGEIIYYFPDLQVSATKGKLQAVADYLKEKLWLFTQASSSQVMLSIGLGTINLVLALVLGSLLRDGTIAAQLGGVVAFTGSIYWLLLIYGIAFLAIPLIRYFWLQQRNQKIASRNQARQQRAEFLLATNPKLQEKMLFAHQFAKQEVISDRDLAYTTETDLIDQNLKNSDKIAREWRQRLESDSQ